MRNGMSSGKKKNKKASNWWFPPTLKAPNYFWTLKMGCFQKPLKRLGFSLEGPGACIGGVISLREGDKTVDTTTHSLLLAPIARQKGNDSTTLLRGAVNRTLCSSGLSAKSPFRRWAGPWRSGYGEMGVQMLPGLGLKEAQRKPISFWACDCTNHNVYINLMRPN